MQFFILCYVIGHLGIWIPCESKKDKEIVDMTFAENLKMLRKQAGMSQEQLARSLVYRDRRLQNGRREWGFRILKI